MSDLLNALLLAALKRAGKPQASDDVLDAAHGLGLDQGWTPNQLSPLTRIAVARRLAVMKAADLVRVVSSKRDAQARRETPEYEPTSGWDPMAHVPLPQRGEERKASAPAPKQSPFADYDKRELLVIVDGMDQIIQSYRRRDELIGLAMKDVSETVDKVRARFIAEGLRSR
jgi:hypothetical protein